MAGKKSSGRALSKTSFTAVAAKFHSTNSADKSAIIHSAFSPSQFQLSLFASIIKIFDSQVLRLHDTITGQLRCTHSIGLKAKVNCIDWGYYTPNLQNLSEQPSRKKRRRLETNNGSGRRDVVIAIGTSDSEIQMFSPRETKVLGVLREGHAQGIKDFKFVNAGVSFEAWSIGGDNKLVQWNLRNDSRTKYEDVFILGFSELITVNYRTLSLPMSLARTLLPLGTSLLCASNEVYLINPDTPNKVHAFPPFTNVVHTLLPSSATQSKMPSAFLAAAESDRHVIIFDVDTYSIIGSLTAGSEVEHLIAPMENHQQNSETSGQARVLAVVTRDGDVEIFSSPFDITDIARNTNSATLKSIRKPRKPMAVISVKKRSKATTKVSILNTTFEGNDIIVTWAENAIIPTFDRLAWRNGQSGDLMLTGAVEIISSGPDPTVRTSTMNGVKDMSRSHVDDSHTVVTKGGEPSIAIGKTEATDISSAEDTGDSDFGNNENLPPQPVPAVNGLTNGITNSDIIMDDALSEPGSEEDQAAEPSFADLIRANAIDVVDITSSLRDSQQRTLVPVRDENSQPSSSISLGTVLAQSLRTNDFNLLETCLHVHDLDIIRATVERLDSSLATVLLHKLAERLHSRPGRAGALMVWIQWTLVAHGGYLGSQPDIVRKLSSLHRVVKERASSLQPLLSLKGKLDMLEAQMNLRKSTQSRLAIDDGGDDNAAVIYVESQEESGSEGFDEAVNPIQTNRVHSQSKGKSAKLGIALPNDADEEMEMDGTSATAQHLIQESSEEENATESEGEGLIDDEASESVEVTSDNESEEEEHDVMSSADEDDTDSEGPAQLALSNGVPPKGL